MKPAGKTLGWVMVIVLVVAGSTAAKPGYGTISGVVLDPAGTPQMGATIWLISEDAGGRTVSQLLSNQHGAFFTDQLKPGKYSLRVSLPGFLPAMERHVGVIANLTTLLRVQMDSLFSSLDTLRRSSDVPAEPDDWKWVLRSSAATRTILQWRDARVDVAHNNNPRAADSPRTQRPRGLVQVTSGALQPGSPSNLSDSPATAVSYDQGLGAVGRLLLAGQMSYERGRLRRLCHRLVTFRRIGPRTRNDLCHAPGQGRPQRLGVPGDALRSLRTVYFGRSPCIARR